MNKDKCIGCGRCFKVCGRDVLQLMGMDDEGELIAVDAEDDDDDEYEKKVMTVANESNCVGCEACARICPKKCYTHEAMPA
ncbi:MAG: ferredoxin III, nif-specific [Sulfurimicrobium sp.]|nr:ferredoxin III, nif-specific [Sulfurimicrobium sp.]